MPLRNPRLYAQLCSVFGQRNVGIHSPGVGTQFERERVSFGNELRYMLRRRSVDIGEQFSIKCPICHDWQTRCYVHHLYGTPENGRTRGYLRLWHCFNEECQSDFENRKQFASIVLEGAPMLKVDETVNEVPEQTSIEMPGAMISLKYLLKNDPGHRMVQWCLARGMPVQEMARLGVAYCHRGDNRNSRCTDRMVVPMFARTPDGKSFLQAWTARRLSEDVSQPKWLHSRSPTQSILYGLAGASKYRTIVPVEGPGDKWSVGPQATAVLGKQITHQKARKLARAAKRAGDRFLSFVVLLDPAQDEKAKLRGEPHHIAKSVSVLASHVDCPVLGLYLPPWADPGGLDNRYIWNYISREANAAGVPVSREKI